jgi:prevent-host-death family protein
MPRASSVDQTAVNAACFRLMSDGLDPTFAAVYGQLNRRGAKRNVLAAIANWRKTVAREHYAAHATPRVTVTEAVSRLDELLGVTLTTPVVITRGGRDAAVLLSAERYRSLNTRAAAKATA